MVGDIGTSWTKILDENQNYHIFPTKQILKENWSFQIATGHLGEDRCKKYINELEALGLGSLKHIHDCDFTVVDVGSRDTKFLRFKDRRIKRLDWNQSCGATTGFTIELLLKYYDISPQKIFIKKNDFYNITCTVFGIEKIFDSIIKGEEIETALGNFIQGLAFNVFEFALKPKKLYLSGGLSVNPAFVQALNNFTDTISMGRFLLLDGLK